jgi:dienelactone hydrolase
MTPHVQPRGLAFLSALGLALTLWNVVPGSAARPQLTVTPTQGLVDARVRVRVVGLPSRAHVTLAAKTVDFQGNSWSSSVKLGADARGVVDTRGDMSLFWTMRPARHALAQTSLFPADGPTPVMLTASIGGKPAARGTYTRRLAAAGITEAGETLAGQGIVGTYYALPAVGRRPAVLQLGGSAGGHSETPAVLLAAHGYPTLSLAYFGEPGLPVGLHNIPLEYFQKALQWLGQQPGVDPARIVVVGLSRGGEAALLTGVTFPDLVHGVVACQSSSDVQGGFGPGSGPAWTYQGQPVPAEAIAVEKINGPVLAFGAGDDQIASSADAAHRIAARGRAHGRTDISAVIYKNAGHGAGCNFPNVPRPGYATSGSTTIQLGGTPTGNALAAASSWPLLLRFIAHVP